MLLADNEGSHSAACCKAGNTFMPCRICELPREELMSSDLEDISVRDSTRYNEFLREAWPTFCRYVKGGFLNVLLWYFKSVIGQF